MEQSVFCVPAPEKAEAQQRALLIVAWVLIIVGIVVRTWRLGSWPALHGDEAVFGVMASRGVAGDWNTISPIRIYGSPLYPYLLIPFVKLLGNTILAVRILPWISNAIGIWAMYAAARRLFGQVPGLFAAGTFAVLPMGVIVMGRLGWDASLTPGLLAIAAWMCIVAFQDRSIPAAIAAGLMLALGSWLNTPALLAIPALIAALAGSGVWRKHIRVIIITLAIACAFSFPAYRVVSGLFTDSGGDIASTYKAAAASGSTGQWASPWSLHLIARNAIAVLDHWVGAVSTEFFLGDYISLPRALNCVVRALAVAAWMVVLLMIFIRGGRFGRFVLCYLLTIFAIAHISNPAFLNVSHKSRYIVAMVPMVSLIMAFIAHSWQQMRWPERLSSSMVVGAWLLVTIIVLLNIGRSTVEDCEIFITADGDPKLLAAGFLKTHVNPETDLVLCGSWWTYWPIAYYSGEAFPLFSSDLVYAEQVKIDLPTTAARVWYVELPLVDKPRFTGTRIAGWADVADPSCELIVTLVDDPQAAIDWQLADYQRRRAERSALSKQ